MQLEELEERLRKIEEAIEQLKKLPPQYNINIEQVDIHDPVLENLTFRLDELDIQELSGALNLGNNFGVKVKRGKIDKKKAHKIEKEIKKKLKNQHLESEGEESLEDTKHKEKKERSSKRKPKKRETSAKESAFEQSIFKSDEEDEPDAEERWIQVEQDD